MISRQPPWSSRAGTAGSGWRRPWAWPRVAPGWSSPPGTRSGGDGAGDDPGAGGGRPGGPAVARSGVVRIDSLLRQDAAAPVRPARRAGEQRRPGTRRAKVGDGRGLRGGVRRQPSGTCPPHPAAPRPPEGRRAESHRRGVLGRLPGGAAGDLLRRPPARGRLPLPGGLRRVQAGQHLLHPGAGRATRRHRCHRQRPGSGYVATGLGRTRPEDVARAVVTPRGPTGPTRCWARCPNP